MSTFPAVMLRCTEPGCESFAITYIDVNELHQGIGLDNPVLPTGWTVGAVGFVDYGPKMAFCRCPSHPLEKSRT
jgi:hypothetical protein